MSLSGQVIVGGFSGSGERAIGSLARGDLGGIILFKRNLGDGPVAAARFIEGILTRCEEPRPVIAVDQEGGRVARFGAPLLVLPPARVLAAIGDEAFLEEAGRIQGQELACLGFSTSFAPVLDIHTHEDNPVIGDRAFGTGPEETARLALAFARGLRRAGLFSCGKHYPGHGRTTKDSHFELPVVAADEAELVATELFPFRRAAESGMESFMTAHVLYPALDDVPATLSSKICTKILRDALGFRGVLFSDDLEMKALSAPIEELAVKAIVAGCDALLICSSEELQERARVAIEREADRSLVFRGRLFEAVTRFQELRRTFPSVARPNAFEAMLARPERLAFERDLSARREKAGL